MHLTEASLAGRSLPPTVLAAEGGGAGRDRGGGGDEGMNVWNKSWFRFPTTQRNRDILRADDKAICFT